MEVWDVWDENTEECEGAEEVPDIPEACDVDDEEDDDKPRGLGKGAFALMCRGLVEESKALLTQGDEPRT